MRAVSLRLVRRMNMVPAFSHSQPTIGQSRISALATKRARCAALITEISNQEIWLGAVNRFRLPAAGFAPWMDKTRFKKGRGFLDDQRVMFAAERAPSRGQDR